MWGRYWKKMHNIFFINVHIFIYLIDREKGGQCIYFRSFAHIIEFLMNIWQLILIRSQIIIWSYLCDQNWWNITKKKIDTSFHQRSMISVFQIWFNVYLLTSYVTRFGLWIFMSKSTHDFWLWTTRVLYLAWLLELALVICPFYFHIVSI